MGRIHRDRGMAQETIIPKVLSRSFSTTQLLDGVWPDHRRTQTPFSNSSYWSFLAEFSCTVTSGRLVRLLTEEVKGVYREILYHSPQLTSNQTEFHGVGLIEEVVFFLGASGEVSSERVTVIALSGSLVHPKGAL